MKTASYPGNSARFAIYSYRIISLLVLCTVLKVYLGDKMTFFNFDEKPEQRTAELLSDALAEYLNKAAENPKILLDWHPEGDLSRVKNDAALGWECGSCLHTWNTSKLDDSNTAAVVILYKYVKPALMPPRSSRKSHQLYVWLTGESPASILLRKGLSLLYADSVAFNATMSYRRDASVYAPYGRSGTPPVENLPRLMKAKKRLAVAFVSNCDYTAGSRFRKIYLDVLSSKMELYTFGRCFNDTIGKKVNPTKFLNIISQYKFYFAFENSYHCRDYITEKFHRNAILGNSVPVVWGPPRSDYEAVADPRTFIHVDDFEKAEDLIRYLSYLDKNDTAYEEYLTHRSMKNADTFWENRKTGICQLCRIVNGINLDDRFNSKYNESLARPIFTEMVSQRTVPSLSKWILEDSPDCFQELSLDNKGKANVIKTRPAPRN